jgi:hypothetical protein
MNSNTSDIHLLKEKIKTLHSRKEQLEEQLEHNWIYLQDKYPSLISNTLFRKLNQTPKTTILGYLFAVPLLQRFIRYLVRKMIGKAGDILSGWLKK